jgi:hypothetical protein
LQPIAALEGSHLQSFAYDGKSRVLEIEFRVTAPFVHGELPLPPPPRVIQYFEVPRYIFTKLIRCKTGRRQEIFWADGIRTRYKCQTVRTVCRVPRVYHLHEALNIRRFQFEEYTTALAEEERQALCLVITAMKLLLLKTLSPRRVAGLGGLIECQSCGVVGATLTNIRHRNCLWFALHTGRLTGRRTAVETATV